MKTENELRKLYGEPSERALRKELPALDKHARNFISLAPFVVISTADNEGNLDASPRGGAPGFVVVRSNSELLLPDAKGNNRLDSLRNILETGKVGMLFMIPGIDETLRLNGSARLSTSAADLAVFEAERIPPKACIVINVEKVFLHCAKAFMRSKLWSVQAKMDPALMPSMGAMLKDQIPGTQHAESRAAMVERYKKDL